MDNRIVTWHNNDTKEYFFSTDHCQSFKDKSGKSDELKKDEWVPVTTYLPYFIKPREGFPDGVLRNREEYKKFQDQYDKEIPNPNPDYQA